MCGGIDEGKMIPKAITKLQPEDFDRLVADRVQEGNQLDFKQALVGGTDADKKKFAADVCAFANTRGGDIVFGVREARGVAVEVVPLAMDPDHETLRLQNMIADSFDPRIVGVQIAPVVYGAGHLLVVRVSQSVQGLHRSKLDQHFHIRESRSNRHLDVASLITRVDMLRGQRDRREEFLAERYAAVLTNRIPVALRPGPKVMVHVFQAHAAFGTDMLDVAPAAAAGVMPIPTLGQGGADFRMSFEGPLHHTPVNDGMTRAFTLVHHAGVLEGAWKVADPREGRTEVVAETVETQVLNFVRALIERTRGLLTLDVPLVVRVALVGAEGAVVVTSNRELRRHFEEDAPLSAIDRTALQLPDVLVNDWPIADFAELFRPAFDRLWQASGFLRSYQYQKHEGRFVWQG
jgi:hypothetical protein